KEVIRSRVDATAYREFISYFPNLIFGEGLRENQILLPRIQLTDDLLIGSIACEEEDEWIEDMYAVGKIPDYKGLDVFIIEEVYQRQYEDSYDNHVDDRVFMIFFEQGSLICKKENKYKEITLFSRYHGEGGENCLKSYFLPDTTIISAYSFSISESATGFVTPIHGIQKYHWEIGCKGEESLLKVDSIRFSSPFFEQEAIFRGFSTYPTEEIKELLFTAAGYRHNVQLFTDDIRIYFYCHAMEDGLITVFETQDRDGNILDKYTVGDRVNNQYPVKPQEVGNNWPVIETSDGDIVV
ncbi:MAG: hypothetical protein LIP01_16130, partial [Tannerellaceae bacterium]|nr:hypothetical protein [Tannerellaceae bacterium]